MHFPIEQIKTVYKKTDENLVGRDIIENGKIVKQLKRRLLVENFFRKIGNLYLDIEYKESEEVYKFQVAENKCTTYHRLIYYSACGNRWSLSRQIDRAHDDVYLSVENEHVSSLDEFCRLVENDSYFNFLKFTFNNHFNFEKITDLNITREFRYKCDDTDELMYYAPKLDGVRSTFILFNDMLVFPFLNHPPVNVQPINDLQIFVGFIEVINGRVFIIDFCRICYIDNTRNENYDISPADSITILQDLKMLNPSLDTNVFFKDYQDLEMYMETTQLPTDGYLAIFEKFIKKYKSENTIDLLYVVKKKSFDLLFKCNISFIETFKNYKIKHFSPPPKNSIIEFKISSNTLEFLRFRPDKVVPNSLNTFKEMLKQMEY